MKGLIILLAFLSLVSFSHAKTTIRIKAIGSSPKGKYVAFEEFGYINNTEVVYSKIKVMNVWKQKYVGKAVNVKGNKKNNLNLTQVRAKAKKLASKNLKKFNILDS